MEREEGLHPLRHPLFAPGDVEFLGVGAAKGRAVILGIPVPSNKKQASYAAQTHKHPLDVELSQQHSTWTS
ncbi:MAG: hypothetical protein WC986_13495 [Elusimicrobiota bacterium]|jgi:hypothetical protein